MVQGTGLFSKYATAMAEAINENSQEYKEWKENISPMNARQGLESKLMRSIMNKGRGRFDPKLVRMFINMELTFG